MTSSSGIPRPFSITDAKRAREEEARKREQATSARNPSSTTIGSGGRLDVVGGDLTITDGGNAAVKDGGAFRVEGGGSMEIVDNGEVIITGSVYDQLSDVVRVAQVALRTEEITYENVGWTTCRPGIFFSSDGVEGANLHSFLGDDVNMVSARAPVTSGPLVGPDINQSSATFVAPESANLSSAAFYKTGADMTDSRSTCVITAAPDYLLMELCYGSVGEIGSIRVSIADPKLRLSGRDGVDVKGPFTVDGLPVVGGVTSVNTKTGAVVLAKGDIGLGNVDNTTDAAKPVSTATQTALNGKANSAHTHTTNQVTGLDTALAGKASTSVATTTTDGLMSAADKVKLDAAGSATLISCYIGTGSKANFATGDQAISSPVFSASRSNANLATPAAGKLTVTDAGVYTITFSLALFTTAAMTAIKPVTGRSFVDISDSASVPYSRTAIPVGEDVTTGNQGGLLLAAGTELKFNIIQTSGGTAFYRATIWIVKHP